MKRVPMGKRSSAKMKKVERTAIPVFLGELPCSCINSTTTSGADRNSGVKPFQGGRRDGVDDTVGVPEGLSKSWGWQPADQSGESESSVELSEVAYLCIDGNE